MYYAVIGNVPDRTPFLSGLKPENLSIWVQSSRSYSSCLKKNSIGVYGNTQLLAVMCSTEDVRVFDLNPKSGEVV